MVKRLAISIRLKREYLCNKIENYKKYWFRGEIILTLIVLGLCSCQRRPKITVYMDPSMEQSITDDLHVENGNYQDALQRCQDRLKLFSEDSIEAADIYSIMGGIYAEYVEDRNKALFYLDKAITIHQRQKDEIGLALDFTKKSKIYIDEKQEEGLIYLEKAEQIYKKYGMENAFGLADVYIKKGHLCLKAGKYEEALDALNQAQNISETRNKKNYNINLLKGEVYLSMQEYYLAEEQYLEAQEVSAKLNNQYDIAIVKIEMAWFYSSINEHSKAIEQYKQALVFFIKDENYLINVANIYNNMAYSYARLKEVKKTLEASIEACRAIEKMTPVTKETLERNEIYKHNLSMYYKGWSKDMSEEGFEAWYQRVVLEEEDWKV